MRQEEEDAETLEVARRQTPPSAAREAPASATDIGQLRPTPTDPSLEFDMFELVRCRFVEALTARGMERLQAEHVALHLVQGLRPVVNLMKVLTRVSPPTHAEILEAMRAALDETPALEQAKLLLLGKEDAGEQIHQSQPPGDEERL